jgi:hypothetical protein
VTTFGKSGKDLERAAAIAGAGWGVAGALTPAAAGGRSSNIQGRGGFRPPGSRVSASETAIREMNANKIEIIEPQIRGTTSATVSNPRAQLVANQTSRGNTVLGQWEEVNPFKLNPVGKLKPNAAYAIEGFLERHPLLADFNLEVPIMELGGPRSANLTDAPGLLRDYGLRDAGAIYKAMEGTERTTTYGGWRK